MGKEKEPETQWKQNPDWLQEMEIWYLADLRPSILGGMPFQDYLKIPI